VALVVLATCGATLWARAQPTLVTPKSPGGTAARAQPTPEGVSAPAPAFVTRVVTAEVTSGTRDRELHVHGVTRTRDRAQLSFQLGGRLAARDVDVGDRVRAGQPIARLDARAFQNAVAAAEAGLGDVDIQQAQLARDEARARALEERGATTVAIREQAETGALRVAALRRAAEVELRESRRQAGETRLHAPFAGVVTAVFVEPGELVQPGQPIVRVAGEGGLEVVVEATPAIAAQLAPGAAAALRVIGLEDDDPNGALGLEGRVRSVVAQATGIGGLHPVLLDLPADARLRAGASVEVVLRTSGEPALGVPLEAVLDPSGQRPFVWRIRDGRAERAWLRLGRLLGAEVEVREGLAPGERVVIRGHERLLEGDVVDESRIDAALPSPPPSARTGASR
jgi:RND family efflux transporter MFP subunit